MQCRRFIRKMPDSNPGPNPNRLYSIFFSSDTASSESLILNTVENAESTSATSCYGEQGEWLSDLLQEIMSLFGPGSINSKSRKKLFLAAKKLFYIQPVLLCFLSISYLSISLYLCSLYLFLLIYLFISISVCLSLSLSLSHSLTLSLSLWLSLLTSVCTWCPFFSLIAYSASAFWAVFHTQFSGPSKKPTYVHPDPCKTNDHPPW